MRRPTTRRTRVSVWRPVSSERCSRTGEGMSGKAGLLECYACGEVLETELPALPDSWDDHRPDGWPICCGEVMWRKGPEGGDGTNRDDEELAALIQEVFERCDI